MMFVLLYIVIANVVFVQYSVFGIWVSGLLLVVSGIIMYMCIGNGQVGVFTSVHVREWAGIVCLTTL